MDTNIKFIIVSPPQKSGGSLVLHYLCKLLIDKGFDAKILLLVPESNCKEKYEKIINYWISYCFFITKYVIKLSISFFFKKLKINDYFFYRPIRDIKLKFLPFFNKKKTIVIYPEIVYGNLLKANNVVRWLLYYNRYSQEPNAYSSCDLFFAYRDIFNDIQLNPNKRLFSISYFNLNLYKQTNFSERKGKCYMIRKGEKRNDLPKTFEGPIIDKLSEFKIVEAFNTYKYCFCYDMQTAYSSIAALCGCIPVLIPEEGKSREDYCGIGETRYGQAFGFSEDEIRYAIETRPLLIRQFEEMNKNDSSKVDDFLKYIFDYFNV